MRIEDFKDRHRGSRCFLLGSGPSLVGQDLSLLRDDVTFACNNGYRLAERIGSPLTYWAVEDTLDHAQFGAEFAQIDQRTIKFASDDLRAPYAVSVPFNKSEALARPRFAAEPPFQFGGTVMYLMLQLAAYMGCSQALLLGNDFNYGDEPAGEFKCIEADDMHFCGEYWPKGTKVFPAQPERMRRGFQAALLAGAMRIVNLTPGSALDVFEAADYEETVREGLADPPHAEQHGSELRDLMGLLWSRPPHHVIELGVRGGGTSFAWHGLSTGLVIGVDKTETPGLASRLPRFRSVVGNSHEADTFARVAALLNKERADFLFIDGDHSYKGAVSDYDDYRHLVKPGGVIAFHDINADPGFFEVWEEGGVPRFWREMRAEKTEYSIHASWGGIGVVRA